jgi:sec-independent protein translocase protein TatB
MFEVGFTELLVIFVLALVVLGPEKLPRLAQQVGRWIGRARAMAKQFREQLEDEVNLADMKKWQDSSSSSSPASKPTSAQPDLGAQPASSPYTDSAQTSAPHGSEASASPPQSTTSEPTPAAGTPEQPAASPGHYAGPPPEPEAAIYEPPAYASASSSKATNGATPHEPSSDAAHAVESPAASPSPASDERPARPGDVITHTHERGI